MRISDWSSDVCSSDLEGIGEATRAAQIFKFFAGEALRIQGEKLQSVRPGVDVEITREPVGIVGIITPWNFPIAIPAWKIAPALAYGNCVVFRPADLVPGCAWAIADRSEEHTSELQSLMRISYAVFCLKKKT